MKRIFLIAGIILITLFSASAFASREFKTASMSGGFIASGNANFNYTGTVSFVPPDGVDSVTYAKVTYFLDTFNVTKFSLVIDNKSCNPVSYTIPANQSRYKLDFDCTGLIKYGNFSASLWSNTSFKNFYGDYQVSYMNNPISMGYGGTEYTVGQNGTVFLRLLDANSNPINLASCNATVFYPNKTQWLKQGMTLLDGGYYYDDFIVPSIVGVYVTGFDCIFPSTPWSGNQSIGIELDATTTDYSGFIFFDDTNNVTINSAYLNVSETGSIGGSSVNFNFNGNLMGSLSGSGVQLGNYVLTSSNFVIGDAQSFTFSRTGSGTNTLNWVRLYVNYTYNSQPFMIRGQTELHVSNPVNVTDITGNVWNYTNRTLTNYNQTWQNGRLVNISSNQNTIMSNQVVMNSTLNSIGSNITSVNNTVNYWGNLLSGMLTSVNDTLNYWGNALTNLINSIPALVWNYTTRNLTYYPPAVNITNYTLNITNQTVEVVNQTLNLTVLNQTVEVTNYTLNVTQPVINLTNYTVNLTNETNIFNYTYPLNLTVLNQTVNVTANNETNIYNYSYNYSYNYTNPLNLTVLNQTVEVTNYTLNLTNYTLNITNQTVEVTNYTLNVTQPIIEVNNYTNNVTTYELNLTNYTLNVTQPVIEITNYTLNVTEPVINLTNYTLNITNQTVEVVNQTLNLTVLNQTVEVTNYTLNVTQPVIELTNYTINVTDVNLTVLNQTLNITNVSTDTLAQDVWNYDNRNLTWYPSETELTASDVWSYNNRTLTDYNQTGIIGQLNSIQNSLNNIINNLASWVWNYVARYTHGILTD